MSDVIKFWFFFFCHVTITVVVVCTIATAKVPLGFAASLVEERNYNCYNVYFNECLHFFNTT